MTRFTIALSLTAVVLVAMAAGGLDSGTPIGVCIALAGAGALAGLGAWVIHRDQRL